MTHVTWVLSIMSEKEEIGTEGGNVKCIGLRAKVIRPIVFLLIVILSLLKSKYKWFLISFSLYRNIKRNLLPLGNFCCTIKQVKRD